MRTPVRPSEHDTSSENAEPVEQPDDTTNNNESSPVPEKRPVRGSYYYDDATGYEVYNPNEDDEDTK